MVEQAVNVRERRWDGCVFVKVKNYEVLEIVNKPEPTYKIEKQGRKRGEICGSLTNKAG